MKTIYISSFIFSVFIFLSSCSNNNEASSSADTIFENSFFALNNIENTLIADNFFYDENYIFYTDKKKSKQFVKLDSSQKFKLIVPITGIDANYVCQYMDAYFISIQEKVGDYQPIIIQLTGDDYGSLLYIVLDKQNNPVSHLLISGGECGGPISETDSTMEMCPITQAFMNKNKINWYRLHVTERKITKEEDKIMPSIIDSVYFQSEINTEGKMITKIIDSTRYERIFHTN